jgi:spore maturation protein CgeB
LYDLHITTKSYNVGELEKLGARDVLFIDNAFDPETHRPVELTREEHERFDAGVGFVGSYETDRAAEISRLAESDVEVRIWGAGWSALGPCHGNVVLRGDEIHGLDYARAMVATRINLCFLRKVNRDLQTTRSIEIPACGAFMLAERTDEHLALFEEGREAEFFSSSGELLEKCRYYLEHEAQRRRVAEGGLRRCIDGGYSNAERLARVLEYLERNVRVPAAGPTS